MKWVKNLSINLRLFFAFLIIAVIALVIGIIGLNSVDKVSNNSTLLYQNSVKPISLLIDIASYFQRGRSIARDFLIINYLPEVEKEIENFKGKLKIQEEAMDKYEKLINTPEKRKAFDNLKEIHSKYVAGCEEYYRLARENLDNEAFTYLNGDFDNIVMDEIKAINELVKIETEYANNLENESQQINKSSSSLLLTLIIIGLALAIFLSYLFMKIIGGKVA